MDWDGDFDEGEEFDIQFQVAFPLFLLLLQQLVRPISPLTKRRT
jgi:hypothetical protein